MDYITIFILYLSQFFQINLSELFVIFFQGIHPEDCTPLKKKKGVQSNDGLF